MIKNKKETPLYAIGVTAKLLGVSQQTLRLWEAKHLIHPARLGKDRLYSQIEFEKLQRIKQLLKNNAFNIKGVKQMLELLPCWEIKHCPPSIRKKCLVFAGSKERCL